MSYVNSTFLDYIIHLIYLAIFMKEAFCGKR